MTAVSFKVKAIFEYSSPHADDLSFPNGQIITVTEAEDDDWYTGEFVDAAGVQHDGLFPRNFVEKYEPEIPSRPTRATRAKKDNEASTSVPAAFITPKIPTESTAEPEILPDNPPEASSSVLENAASLPVRQASARQPPSSTAPKPSEQPPPKPSRKNDPNQEPDKPSGGSFKDRIAAFNKPAAPPISPFKPGAQGTGGSTGFIKKPFVAPPPSKNAYVPPPREPPVAKIYRREEDPALNEMAEDSEASMPMSGQRIETVGEDQSPPTSLKDRIALLQKQQLEQAARHVEAAQKKEKPKRPSKKRTESQEPVEASETTVDADLQRLDTSETVRKRSVDFADDDSEAPAGHGGRQPSSAAVMSTPPPPSRELMSDTNDADYSAAGDTEEAYDTSTSREDDREKGIRAQAVEEKEPVGANAAASESDEMPEEVEDVDPEIKRRMEIRERMAKMSGGMGLMGMFGPQGGMPRPAMKTRAGGEAERSASIDQSQPEALERAPPVPVRGMSSIRSPEQTAPPVEDDSSTEEDARQTPLQEYRPEGERSDDKITEPPRPPPRASIDRTPPSIPQGRAVPPPPPQRDSRTPPPAIPAGRPVMEVPSSPPQGRVAPPPPPRTSMPLSRGESSDDEISAPQDNRANYESPTPSRELPSVMTAPHLPLRPANEDALSNQVSPTSTSTKEKRTSRGLPPLPPSSPLTSSTPQFRAPPPPPPAQPPSRKSTSQSRNLLLISKQEKADASEGEVTEYDGDYDTDIASSAKHKDALKSHARDSSFDEDKIVDQSEPKATASPPGRGPPPLPNISAPRDVPPPPPPTQMAKTGKKSIDLPRVAPPPIPPSKQALPDEDDDDYDSYHYKVPQHGMASPTSQNILSPSVRSPDGAVEDDELYDASPQSARAPPLPTQAPPPPVPSQPPQPPQNAPRQSQDMARSQNPPRRSMEVPRPSGEQGFMAADVDLAPSSQWYVQTPDVPPPSLQRRNDILFETESSSSSKRGGKTTVSKDIYILYPDYSQTIITANFDASDPTNVSLEQHHERPPPTPRQDQLEAASAEFGSRIASSMALKASTTIGDGTPHALILDLLRSLSPSVLLSIGTRAYGAPVYANLANASITQLDEIRPGDIVTFRNAKFAGHRGGLHTKYSMEVGKPDHVAVVADWDGTKKKIRVWEQKGKEKEREKEGAKGGQAKVKEESYRVADLKSGEVRVWRVMGRGWVGWEGGSK